MERLTNKREADQDRRNYQKRLEQGYPRNVPEERFLKLAAYEDTGLEPWEIEGLKNALCVNCPIPPCKIGDSVFYIRNFSGGVKRAVPGVVSEMYYVGPGMTLAIEPMVNAGSYDVKVMPDGWTVKTADGKYSAHYENTIAITDGEPEILTVTEGL